MKANVNTDNDTKSVEMEAWYRRMENSKTIYHPHSQQPIIVKEAAEVFLKQSLLFRDENFGHESHLMSYDVVELMTGFSAIMEEDEEYSFLAFVPIMSGSMREKTKTFSPNEFDLTLALKNTTGLEIVNKKRSYSLVKVYDTADRRWLSLCIKDTNILCPTKLKRKFQYGNEKVCQDKNWIKLSLFILVLAILITRKR